MSPYLLFGLIIAALLNRFLSVDTVANHLGKSNIFSVIKSVLFGIPLPLCSCSVIPAGVLLKQKGASKGAVISFFIATPITGVDSIFATYSLLGGFFTVFRIVAATITSLVAGLLANIFLPAATPQSESPTSCKKMDPTPAKSLRQVFDYAVNKLLGEIWRPLLVGVLIGGAITFLVPDEFINTYLGSPWLSMVAMLAIAVPMYVCATGSIPIAAALLLKGISPGAALVFLLAGPATNAVTIAVVVRELGRRAAVLYVATIALLSLLFGALLNYLQIRQTLDFTAGIGMDMLPAWIMSASAFTLLLLIIYNMLRKRPRFSKSNKNSGTSVVAD